MATTTETGAYKQRIAEEIKNCNDLELLDFIYRLLTTAGEDDQEGAKQ